MSEKRLTPSAAVRHFCMECMGGHWSYVRGCTSEHCLFFNHRDGHGGRVSLRLMRTYCLHCNGWPVKDGKLDPDYKDGGQGWARDQARNCSDPTCPLYPYRPGTNPFPGQAGRGFALRTTAKGAFKAVGSPETIEDVPGVGGDPSERSTGPEVPLRDIPRRPVVIEAVGTCS